MDPSRGSSAGARSTSTTDYQVTLKFPIQRDVSPFAEGCDMDSKMLIRTTSNDNRDLGIVLNKVEKLTNGLETVGNDMNEQEARLDTLLNKVVQLIYPRRRRAILQKHL